MSEVATAEPVAEPSAVSTPPSTDPLELVPSPEGTAAKQDQGGEPPAPTEPPPRTPDTYDLDELNGLYGKGKLDDPALVTRRESLIKSANDRWLNEQDNLNKQRLADEARTRELTKLRDDTKTKLATERAKIMARPLDEETRDELLAERETSIIEDYHSKAEAIALAPHVHGLREAVLRLQGDTVRNRQTVNSKSLPELVQDIFDGAFEAGRKAGPDDKHVVMTLAERDAYAEAKLDEYKAANPLPGTVSTSGAPGSAGATHDFAWLNALPIDEYEAVPEDERRRIWSVEERRRAGAQT